MINKHFLLLVSLALSIYYIYNLCSLNKFQSLFKKYINAFNNLIKFFKLKESNNLNLIQDKLDEVTSSGLKIFFYFLKFLFPYLLLLYCFKISNYLNSSILFWFVPSFPYLILFTKKENG